MTPRQPWGSCRTRPRSWIWRLGDKKLFLAGDWFGYKDGRRDPGKVDPYSMIIPTAMADKLRIKPQDVGKAKVEFDGSLYTVIAIIKNGPFRRLKDLDNEPMSPADFMSMNNQNQRAGRPGLLEAVCTSNRTTAS